MQERLRGGGIWPQEAEAPETRWQLRIALAGTEAAQ